MAVELKLWEFCCTRCTAKKRVTSIFHPPLPKGWKRVEVRDCGMTGYTRSEERCPKCAKKD